MFDPVLGGIATFSFPYKCTTSSPLLITRPLFTMTLPWTSPPASCGPADSQGDRRNQVGRKARATKHRRTVANQRLPSPLPSSILMLSPFPIEVRFRRFARRMRQIRQKREVLSREASRVEMFGLPYFSRAKKNDLFTVS